MEEMDWTICFCSEINQFRYICQNKQNMTDISDIKITKRKKVFTSIAKTFKEYN